MRTATGQSGTDLDPLDELEERMKRLRIESSSSSPDLVIHGNAFQGYAVNVPSCEPVTASTFVCPETLNLTFSEVQLDCGCVPIDESGSHSSIFTDGGLFNDNTTTLVRENPCPPTCFLEDQDYTTIFVHQQRWLSSDICDGDPTDEFDAELGGLFVIFDGTTWHVWAEIRFTSTVVFYGTTTDISMPIPNTLTCSSDFVTFDNAVTTCVYGGPVDFTVAGHDGVVTLS